MKKTIRPEERKILRELARQYLEICARPVQEQRRALWRDLNSLRETRPLIYIRQIAWREMPASRCLCENLLARHFENFFRHRIFWDSLDDDSIFEPWVTVRAVHTCEWWGPALEKKTTGLPGGSFKIDYPLRDLSDIRKLRLPRHEIDEEATESRLRAAEEALGDIITVNVDRSPAYLKGMGDISTSLGYLRGIENFMLDMVDNPEWLHRLAGFLSAGILKTHREAEAAGDWGLCAHDNQAMPYSLKLEDPRANVNDVGRRRLWGYMHGQDMACVSPAMHEEFLLRYQVPILETFGLTAYGCCEDLTNKIGILRRIPNLRRIAVSPGADVAACAERIGRDYVMSYRPSPADMVSYGLNAERVSAILRRDLAACRGCRLDITLKDVETVQGDPDRIRQWVSLARRVAGEIF